MDRLNQTPIAEPIPPSASGGSVLRTTFYGLLALMLAGGAWIRFNEQIATVAPALAAPAQALAQNATNRTTAGVQSLMELSLLDKTEEPAAVAGLGLPTGQAIQLDAALRRNQLRLVQMPLFDAGASLPDGSDAGRAVLISSGGFSRIVQLTRKPVVVTLPIDRAGTVAFKVASNITGAIGIGALTANGPVQLPDLSRGQELDVGVIAQ